MNQPKPSAPPLPPADEAVQKAVALGLAEDCGAGDITSLALVGARQQARARIFAKQDGVLAGLLVAEAVFRQMDSRFTFKASKEDGDFFSTGDTLLEVQGPARELLTAERTALNFLQRLSGIATQAARYAQAVAHTKTRILDTRKTTPGLRELEKYAVRCGGALNHRMGLYDEFMIKDNHIALMQSQGGLAEAVARARQFKPSARLVVEAQSLEQVKILAGLPIDRILLDNMDNSMLAQAVHLVAGRVQTEASGNMTLQRLPSVAATGVDYISVGALTHSAPALDLSMDIEAA